MIRRLDGVPNDPLSEDVRAYQDWSVDGDRVLRDHDAHAAADRFRAEITAAEGHRVLRVHEFSLAWSDRNSDEYLGALKRAVLEDIGGLIEQVLDGARESSPEAAERAATATILGDLSEDFVGREEEVAEALRHLEHTDPGALVVCGPSGAGKSAFLARLHQALREHRPEGLCVSRFCGSTPDSSVARTLIHGLAQELLGAGTESGVLPLDASLQETWRLLLEGTPATQPIFLLIDAVDELEDDSGQPAALEWLRAPLPPHVRVVISSRTEEVHRLAAGLDQLELAPFSAAQARVACETRLRAQGRLLQHHQWEQLERRFAHGVLPLYVRIASDLAARWRSDEEPHPLPDGVEGLIARRLDYLEAPERHGSVLLLRALSYLRNARDGLAEDEWLALLSRDDEVWNDFEKRARHTAVEHRLPDAVWSRR